MNIQEVLRREVEELGCIEREVQEKVSQAKEAGEKIDEQVYEWLEEAQHIGIKVTTNWPVDVKAKSTLVNRLFCCNCWSKKPKEDPLKIKTVVNDLIAQGKNIFPAKGIELVWRDGFLDFGSRRSTFARIMEGLQDDNIGIIGIYGLGGIGKTRLVTEIGKRAKDENLFDQVLMATVSQNPDIRRIQWTLADMLDLNFKDDADTSRANELRARLKRERKVLVIMDDVWEGIDMDSVGVFPYSNQKGCKIVVTTRREKVCEDMCCNLVFRLDVIKYVEAWALFSEYADLKDQKSNLVLSKAKNIVKECGGLPLAIVVVGSALRGKDLEDYEDALKRLSSSSFVDVESADREIYTCLKLSYDYLEDEDTKKCFLLCSVFPEDSTIAVKELTRYAHGQWLFQNVYSFDEARKRILASVRKLEDACLLSHVTRVRHRKGDYFQTWPSVKMHDMVRDFALWIAKGNADFFFVLTSSKELHRKRTHVNATAFYVIKFDLDWQFPNKLEYPNLKILIITSYISPLSLENFPENFLEVTSGLQVLDVGAYSSRNVMLPPIMLESLSNLRSLRLSGELLSRDKDMSMIGKSKNLELLELNLGLKQRLLPEWIGELCNLRVLDLSGWYSLEVIPSNLLSRLAKLEELYTPFFHPRGKWVANYLSDLRFLPRLTVFAGTFIGFQSLPGDFRFGNLQMYYINCRPRILKDEGIRWTRSLGLDDVNDLSMKVFEKLLPEVECLKIVGSEYIRDIKNICPQIDNAGFQNLRELFLEGFYSIECLVDTTGSGLGLTCLITVFPNLVHLTLENMRELRKMCCGPPPISYLGELRKASIIRCPRLENIVPDMLPIESKLETLEIKECYHLKHVFEVDAKDHMQPLACPAVIELSDLFELQSIWNVPLHLEFIDKDKGAELCKQIVKCQDSLAKIKIQNCLVLEEVFPVVEVNNQKFNAQLSNLVELELVFLPKMKSIWTGHQQSYSLENLKRIELEECDTLSAIFTSTLAQSLQKLKYLVIEKCKALETIIMQDDQDEATRNPYSSSLPKAFQAIKKIKIESCDKLKTVLPYTFIAQGLPKLESISINDCAELEQVFGIHGEENVAEGGPLVELNNKKSGAQLSNLVELHFALIPKLKCIWSGPQQDYSLQNLKHIELEECDALTSLFTSTLAQSLHKLQYLVIKRCKALETVVMHVDQVEVIREMSFQEIKEIHIKSCDKLKIVLPISFVAQGLPKLESILIEDCAELEHVFGHQGQDNVEESGQISMKNLKQLVLLDLPGLVSISPLKCYILFSSLSLMVDRKDSAMDLLNLL